MALTWAAVGTWGATALGGLAMAFVFLRHNGMAQSERNAIGPLRVLPHVGFAVAGFGLWVAYAVTKEDDLAWAALSALGVAFLIAGTFMLTREQHRRAELARALSPAAPVDPGTRTAIAAEHFIPIWLAGAHGLIGAGTLLLVCLQRSGFS